MKKITLTIIFALILSASFASTAFCTSQPKWTNVCGTDTSHYCQDVGKSAFNATGNKFMRNIKLGEIIGVAWRPKGSVIGVSAAVPSAGIPASVRTSPRNAYYFIIDDGSNNPFIRQCREISPK
jgi:hypothetical protein